MPVPPQDMHGVTIRCGPLGPKLPRPPQRLHMSGALPEPLQNGQSNLTMSAKPPPILSAERLSVPRPPHFLHLRCFS